MSRLTSDIVDFIIDRRSAQGDFTDQQIPIEALVSIVQCGLSAPSSKNATPWRFHVVSEAEALREIADVVESSPGADRYAPADPKTGELRRWPSSVAESAHLLRHAGAAVFVENTGAFSNGRPALAETRSDRLPDALVGYTFEVLGLGAAIQNMLLGGLALGLQGRFMGDILVAEEFIKNRLGIQVDLVGVVVFGYADAEGSPRTIDAHDPRRVVWHTPGGPSDMSMG